MSDFHSQNSEWRGLGVWWVSKGRGGKDESGEYRGLLKQWKYSEWYSGGGYIPFYIHQNTKNVPYKEKTLT